MIWRGIAIGIIISAPMGPVGILCVQRTLEKGRRTGFFTGIGAAISDMFYCLITGFGLSFIEEFLTRNHNIIQLIGSVVLIAFGVYLFKSNPTRALKKPEEGISDKRNILNGFLFTFSNPLIIFLIIGLFARFNFLVPEIKFYHYVIGFLSIGAGALLWWLVVTFFVAKLRTHFNLRSMWLINKIIGGIIFIFATVGIVTAISAMASASPRAPSKSLYMNKARGFHGFRNASDTALIIYAASGDPITDMIPLSPSHSFSLSFRAANLNNASGKSYPITTGNNNNKKRKHPSWGLVIKGTDRSDTVTITTYDNPLEENYDPATLLFRLNDGKPIKIRDGVDFFTGMNSFRLDYNRGETTLYAGNREYKPILSWHSDIEMPDSIGFLVTPGGKISVDHLSIEYPSSDFESESTEYGNHDILKTYLMRSKDRREGIWCVFDRSLDEDLLRMGGDYRLALISEGARGERGERGEKGEKSYMLIYLDGATTASALWKPGMIKARLNETAFENVYDVEWYDATGKVISKDVKAQIELPLMTITFPYHSSSLRLRRINIKK